MMAARLDVAASEPAMPCSTMWPAAARSVKNTPSRLTSSTRRHSAVVMVEKPPLSARRSDETPALAKQAVTLPSSATVSANRSATSSSLDTSQRIATDFTSYCRSTSSAAAFFASFVPQMQTSPPAWAMASAKPRPMPLLPPVIRAALPARLKGS